MGLFDNPTEKGRKFSDLNKYVTDFRLERETDQRGRIRTRAVYVGPWTVMRRTGTETRIRLWGTFLLTLGVAGCQLWMLMLNHLGAGVLWVMFPLLVGLLPGLYLLMGSFSLPFRGKPMRRDQYMHSFIRVSRSAVAVSAFTLVGLLASLVYRMIRGDWRFLPADWQFLAACGLIIAQAVAAIFLLRSIDLMEKDNDAYEPQTL